MKFTHMTAVLMVAAIGCLRAGSAAAQGPGGAHNDAPAYSSTVSPYLFLVPQSAGSGGTTVSIAPAAGTYQALVRPMLEARDEKFRQSLSPSQPGTSSAPGPQARPAQTTGFSSTMRPTGHSATFLNTSHYYPVPK